jgi:hypothetical protein
MKKLLLISIFSLIFNVFAIKQSLSEHIYNQWKCYSHFGDDAKLVLSIGYFKETLSPTNESVGFMYLKTNDSKTTVLHNIEGIRDSFNWGGEDSNDFKFIITPEGRSWFYDFRGVKEGEKVNSTQTLNCKVREEINYNEEKFKLLMKELNWEF